MALPTSGPISINDMHTVFNATYAAFSLSDYYAGGRIVPSLTPGIPASGTISIGLFRGAGVQPARVVALTTSQTWVVPPGVINVTVFVGAGGGGGGGNGSYNPIEGGGGGGAGGLIFKDIVVTPGQPIDVIIGAGGASGAHGSNTTFGTIIATGGGQGGNCLVSTFHPAEPGGDFVDANGNPYTVAAAPAFYSSDFTVSGIDGGSGGGRCPFYGGGVIGLAIPGQGTNGSNGAENQGSGGGGGGGNIPGTYNGGAPGEFTFAGQTYRLCEGGGGGGLRAAGTSNGYGGGSGGLGVGVAGTSGSSGTGGGGGGGSYQAPGGAGGSGIIFILIPAII